VSRKIGKIGDIIKNGTIRATKSGKSVALLKWQKCG
jgi:hypothetical protein